MREVIKMIKRKKLIVTLFTLFFCFILSNSKAYAAEIELPLDYKTVLANVNNKYDLDLTDDSYDKLDMNRTVAVTFKGVASRLGTSVGNMTLYQEFYYSDSSNH